MGRQFTAIEDQSIELRLAQGVLLKKVLESVNEAKLRLLRNPGSRSGPWDSSRAAFVSLLHPLRGLRPLPLCVTVTSTMGMSLGNMARMLRCAGNRGGNAIAFMFELPIVIFVTKEGVKFSTRGDIETANIICRQNTSVDKGLWNTTWPPQAETKPKVEPKAKSESKSQMERMVVEEIDDAEAGTKVKLKSEMAVVPVEDIDFVEVEG
ncbi:hypothetical protein NL676_004988 [Syzygium grande]|nr:hypothetical protein NL676_004988 [Syzygium grande]